MNGILLGGLLALLALGLNLIFGVIRRDLDLLRAELVMIGMYGMYYLVQVFGLRSLTCAAPFTASCWLRGLGALLHLLVIAPALLSAPPINQLLATGGVLFVLQSFATVAFGIDFRNLGIRMPVLRFAEMHFSAIPACLAFVAALIGMVLVYFFMKRTYRRHRDPRHLPGPPDHGADGRRCATHLSRHLGARRRAGRARVLPAGAAIRRPSVRRPVVRPDHLPDLRARRAGQFHRRLRGGVRVRRDHLARRACFPISNGVTCWPSPSSSS